ncbi:MAG: Appr-1-p processing protein [Gemmatimonadetes bacterium]|nr:macro domain-containing protein [Gemmatimonadota bacterium]NNM03633.1 Appr-1-p processing protein [Gemmatimonadota bacterium]
MPAIIHVVEGDISTYDGDAVVNAANNHLRLGTGVAGALAKRGGGSIQAECDEFLRQHGPLPVGGAAITGGGNLRARYVIHAAAMGDVPVSPESIRSATRTALELAEEHEDISSIAFPVLGTGVGGFPFSEAARIMVEEIRAFTATDSTLDSVVFFGYTPDQAETLRRYLS